NRLIGRLIIPRVPESALLPFVQLIRPTFSAVTAPVKKNGPTHTAFGDIQLFDLGVIPWPNREMGWIMGVGPLFVFPTANEDFVGQQAWQVGPAFGTIYKGLPGFLFGCLIQNPISFAYTKDKHQEINQLLFQPIILAYIGKGVYIKSADSTMTFGW